MSTLIVGASGATGRLLVRELLERGQEVRAIVRSPGKLAEHERLSIIKGSLLDLTEEEMTSLVNGCDAIASCLGHNLSFKGIYGQPRKLVTDATRKLCNAIRSDNSEKPIKFVLMNTAGNSNRDLDEPVSMGQRLVIGAVRLLVPPHSDNEQAADYLRLEIGQNDPSIQWAVVRPDSLLNEERVSGYKIYPSPIRSAIFDPGKTSRINVAHFMADLITKKEIWLKWKGQMPLIYNV